MGVFSTKVGVVGQKFSAAQARQQLRPPLHRILDPPLTVYYYSPIALQVDDQKIL